MTGMTIPGVDILGSKKGYSANKPWLFEDFDQLQFYPVSEEEYEKELAIFNSGRYEYKWEEVTFDMAEHNRLLAETKDEVAAIRSRQRKAQAEMDRIEAGLLEKWAKEKAERGVPVDAIQSLLQGMFTPFPMPYIPLRIALIYWFDTVLSVSRSKYRPYRSASQRKCMESRS